MTAKSGVVAVGREETPQDNKGRPGPKKRIAFFGKTKHRSRSTQHIFRAFTRHGHTVRWFKYNRLRRFLGERLSVRVVTFGIRRFRPDLVFSYSYDIPLEVLRKANKTARTAIYYMDPGKARKKRKNMEKARLADFFFLTNRFELEEYTNLGVKNARFILQGCDPIDHRKVTPRGGKWRNDVSFIGRPSTELRFEILKRVGERYQLAVWGPKRWPEAPFRQYLRSIKPKQYRVICASSKIMLGCDAFWGLQGWFSNRTLITLGCGGFLLTNYQPGLEDIFENRKHLVWYNSVEQCLELIDYYLNNDAERKRIAEAGYHFAHQNHTYDHFVSEVLRTLYPEEEGSF